MQNPAALTPEKVNEAVLDVDGHSLKFTNLKKICEDQLQGRYRIEVIDLLEKPQLAKGDQILLRIWRGGEGRGGGLRFARREACRPVGRTAGRPHRCVTHGYEWFRL